jgi:hypothetical protein
VLLTVPVITAPISVLNDSEINGSSNLVWIQIMIPLNYFVQSKAVYNVLLNWAKQFIDINVKKSSIMFFIR